MADVTITQQTSSVTIGTNSSSISFSGGQTTVSVQGSSLSNSNISTSFVQANTIPDILVLDSCRPVVTVGGSVELNYGGDADISNDSGNILQEGSDDGLYVPPFAWKTTQW